MKVRRDRLPRRLPAAWPPVDGRDVPALALAVADATADRPAQHPRDGVVEPRRGLLALVHPARGYALRVTWAVLTPRGGRAFRCRGRWWSLGGWSGRSGRRTLSGASYALGLLVGVPRFERGTS
jgi:hypothetical protein